MERARCLLPKMLQNLCEMGCIYREPALKHLSCPTAPRKSVCAAPCEFPCACLPPKKELQLILKPTIKDVE